TPTPSAARLPPPISGGTLLVLRDGKTVVASDPDRDLISIVDLSTRQLRAQVTLEPGSEPGRAVEDDAGRVHVVLRGAGVILSVDTTRGRLLARRSLCQAPRGLAFDASKQLLHVACAGGELISIGPLDATPVQTRQLDRDLRDVTVRGTDVLVTTFRKADLLVVPATGEPTRLAPARMPAAFSSGIGVRPTPSGVAGSAPGQGGLASPAVAWRMIDGPDGSTMMLHQRGVDDDVGTQPNAYASGQSCAGIVETSISTMVPGGGQVLKSSRALANAVVAVDMAVAPDGRQVAVVSAGNGGTDQQLQFFDMADVTDAPNPGSAPPSTQKPCVPGSPAPIVVDDVAPAAPAAGAALPQPIDYRPPNGEVIAVAYAGAGNIIVQSRQPASLQVLTQRWEPIVLSAEVRADPGHQLFHSATTGKLACASCHPEGGEDSRVWHFVGVGSRRTQSLRGGIMDTAPFHWSGALRDLGALMIDVFQGRMAGPPVNRDQVGALSVWLDKVQATPPSAGWHDPAAVGRGKALFESSAVGCASCHAGADFTNGTTVDVGTGGLFQVPQLHNLAFRAPYMHDGCAATLGDRFSSCGGGDRHGVTSTLNHGQIDDLVAYLETL
ncbi:MAG TPA: cytochrome-c peroxidase, partial [Polyangia bacterium]|nr:cytochrome-c peroxidase [Polyangia bacterium]